MSAARDDKLDLHAPAPKHRRLGTAAAMREPCPFCRFAAPIYRTSAAKRLVAAGRNKWIECPQCGARGPGAAGWKAANALWNLRRGEVDEKRAAGMIGRRV